MKDFAIFICTHGRPEKQLTYDWLLQHNCTHQLYLLVDNMDNTLDEYRRRYGDKVIVFDKKAYSERTDKVVQTNSLSGVVFARNAAIDLGKSLGYKYICVCDDDCYNFRYFHKQDGKLKKQVINNMNSMFDCLIDFMQESRIQLLSFSPDGSYFGGIFSQNIRKGLLRDRLTQFYIINTETEVQFSGIIREDDVVNYKYNQLGVLMFKIGCVSYMTDKLGSSKNSGMSGVYNELSTKSFIIPLLVSPIRSLKPVKLENTEKVYGKYTTALRYESFAPMVISNKYKK